MITNHTEGTFASLRYTLGGDHPSQTTHHALFPDKGLDSKCLKVGISTTTPSRLATQLQSLPTILHIKNSKSMQSCSEGSWGLSVP